MLSLFPFLLIGLGLSLFVGSDDDDSDTVSDSDQLGGPDGDLSGGDLLDFVEGQRLGVDVLGSDGTPNPVTGGDGDDTITGGDGDDTLNGAGGNDQITGDIGADLITGGDGNDTVDGGDGEDTIDGGAGDDLIDGGEGGDVITGVDGADTLFGGAGDDVLTGSGSANSPTTPEETEDKPTDPGVGSDGSDVIPEPHVLPPSDPPAPTSAQLLDGGEGDDLLYGDTGDTLTGGEGLDTFVVDTDPNGELGPTLITDFDPLTEALTLNLDGFDFGDPTQDGFAFDVETRDLSDDSGMEVLVQGIVVATLAGVAESDAISISIVGENSGSANPGTFTNLGDGDGTATGDLSDDTINGGAGNDVIDGSSGRDVLNGDGGDDTLSGGAGLDNLSGGSGNDLLISGGNDETINTIVLQETLDGGEGDDTLQAGDGFAALTGGEGTDVFEITRTEVPSGAPADPFGTPVTEVTDLDVATEEVNITFVNGDASASPVPFTLVNAPDDSGVAVVIGGEVYAFLTGVLAADNPVVNVTSSA